MKVQKAEYEMWTMEESESLRRKTRGDLNQLLIS